MKRNEEVKIIVDSLVKNELLEEKKTDRARFVVKKAIKEIRNRKFKKKKKKNCQESHS